jgi:hypothetical protein
LVVILIVVVVVGGLYWLYGMQIPARLGGPPQWP